MGDLGQKKLTHRILGVEHAIRHELCHRVEVSGAVPAHVRKSTRHVKTHRVGKHHLHSIGLRAFWLSRWSGVPVSSFVALAGTVRLSRIGRLLRPSGSVILLSILFAQLAIWHSEEAEILRKVPEIELPQQFREPHQERLLR